MRNEIMEFACRKSRVCYIYVVHVGEASLLVVHLGDNLEAGEKFGPLVDLGGDACK